MKSARLLLLPLLLIPLIALFSMSACTAGGTSTGTIPIQSAPQGELSQQELEQIYSDSMMNQANLDFYKFNVDMDIITDIIGGESGKMTIFSESTGAANLIANQSKMQMQMDMTAEGLGYEGGEQSISYDMYQMTDWIYMRMEVPGMGEQWIKMPVSEELNERVDLVDQQLGPLEGAVGIELQGYANVDGEECYVLSLTPDMEKLMDWLSQQQGGTPGFEWGDIPNAANIFDKLEYTYYVTKDTRLPKRVVANMLVRMTAEQAGVYDNSFDMMTMNISMDMTLYDFDQPFSIDLPDEAEDAIQVSEDMFS